MIVVLDTSKQVYFLTKMNPRHISVSILHDKISVSTVLAQRYIHARHRASCQVFGGIFSVLAEEVDGRDR